jgi:F0F1-type ATP synthase membrane subunit a
MNGKEHMIDSVLQVIALQNQEILLVLVLKLVSPINPTVSLTLRLLVTGLTKMALP